jgi:hypothetical protein
MGDLFVLTPTLRALVVNDLQLVWVHPRGYYATRITPALSPS